MSEHPASHRLEALVAGDADADAEAHVAVCAECRDYSSALSGELAAWNESSERERGLARLRDASADGTRTGSTLRVLRWVSVASAPLLVAAAVMLFIRHAPHPGQVPSARSSSEPESGDFGTRFKGAPQIAVIVEHDGQQRRYTDSVVVSAGDRLRVEVSVASTTPIAAGVLTRERQWVPLLLPAELDAGTHFSEQAARFDAEPSEGWVIVGSPDAVRMARKTGDLGGVTALPLRYSRGP